MQHGRPDRQIPVAGRGPSRLGCMPRRWSRRPHPAEGPRAHERLGLQHSTLPSPLPPGLTQHLLSERLGALPCVSERWPSHSRSFRIRTNQERSRYVPSPRHTPPGAGGLAHWPLIGPVLQAAPRCHNKAAAEAMVPQRSWGIRMYLVPSPLMVSVIWEDGHATPKPQVRALVHR